LCDAGALDTPVLADTVTRRVDGLGAAELLTIEASAWRCSYARARLMAF